MAANETWRTEDADALFDAILRLETATRPAGSSATCARSASSATWPSAGRWSACSTSGLHYAEISRETGASTATITRIASWLNHGEGGYRAARSTASPRAIATAPTPPALSDDASASGWRSRTRAASSSRRSRLLHDAGLVFEEHDRSLVARVQNFDLDILFVRTNDIIEFVGDGVADLGVTGDRPAGRDRRRAAARPDARLRPVPPRRRRPHRRPVPGGRGPRRPARRDGPPEHGPPLLRGAPDPAST